MVPERIEREVMIDAPVEVVWAVVTEPRHVGSWFSDEAEIDLRPGGEARLTWEQHGTSFARVEKVEPPHSFSFSWARGMGAVPGAGNSTLVEFSLSPEGERTRLRVVESGFRELDGSEEEKAAYAGENTRGWTHELGELEEYVAQLPASRLCDELPRRGGRRAVGGSRRAHAPTASRRTARPR